MPIAPILAVEVYPGSLDGDDRDPSNPSSTDIWFGDGYTRYPNAMGSQTSGIYEPGPAALSDGDPTTGIRISSAWAAEWIVIADGAVLSGVDKISIYVDITVVYSDPEDSEQYHDVSLIFGDAPAAPLHSWEGGWGTEHAYAETTTRIPPSGTHTIEWVIDADWLAVTHASDGNMEDGLRGYHQFDSDTAGPNSPHDFTVYRSDLLSQPGSRIWLMLNQHGGALPYELQVTRVQIGDPALHRRTHPVDHVRRTFPPTRAHATGRRTSGGYQ